MKPHQYNSLQMAILAQLPRVDPEGQGHYTTAAGLKMDPEAHPLVAQASLPSLRANLGVLARTGACIRNRDMYRLHRRGHGSAYAVQPVKRP